MGITIMAFSCFVGGLVIFGFGVNEARLSLSAKNWQKTEGKIRNTEVVSRVGNARGTRGRSAYMSRFKILVEYSYTVSGKKYIGNRRTFSDSTLINERESAGQIVGSLPVGGVVDVYYSPRDPSQSVLDPALQKSSLYICGFGVVMIFISVSIFFSNRPKNIDPTVVPSDQNRFFGRSG